MTEIEDQEDEHLGMKAIVPPPEEKQPVKTAIGAAKAEQSAEKTR